MKHFDVGMHSQRAARDNHLLACARPFPKPYIPDLIRHSLFPHHALRIFVSRRMLHIMHTRLSAPPHSFLKTLYFSALLTHTVSSPLCLLTMPCGSW